MQRKLVIFDLDDTLLNNSSEVGEYTIKILKKVQSEGHYIAFNTARSQMRSENIYEVVKPDFGIYNGGAQITDKDGKTIFEAGIDKEICNALVPELFSVTDRFSYQNADWFYSANEDYNAPDVRFFDFKNEEFPTGAYKIIAHTSEPHLLEPIAKKFDLDFVTYFGGPFCRFTKSGVNKASGNRALAHILGIELKDVLAFGDDIGDLEMICDAGVGILMKNAKEEVISQIKDNENVEISEYSNHDDGVAAFLVKYFEID
jgi:Cof subfamily protein (haloacid dehalogenase superfamily)